MTAGGIDWETVYKEYEQKVRSYIRGKVGNPSDVDDLCGEVFFNIIRAKDQFSGEPKAVSSWIYMITKRAVAMFYRKHRVMSEIPETMADDTDIEAEYINEETLDQLADSLEKLEERLRDIIILHYYGGKKLKEIAEAMHMSYPNIKILHRKALGQLKKDLYFLGSSAS